MELRIPVAAAAVAVSVTLGATPASAVPPRDLAAPTPAAASQATASHATAASQAATASHATAPRIGSAHAGTAWRPGTAGPNRAATITLTVADNGRRIRVHRGAHILVHLAVDPNRDPDPSTWWRAVVESGRALRARPQTAMPVRGATLGHYRAVEHGEATLTSTRPVCPAQPSGPTCHSVQGWNVTVDVR